MRGDRLREIRIKRGHTQESLAELLGIGSRQIWRYENNETEPDGEKVAQIAQALNVSSDYLLGLTDFPGAYIEGDLTAKERAVIAAWRRGERLEAMRVIANDE